MLRAASFRMAAGMCPLVIAAAVAALMPAAALASSVGALSWGSDGTGELAIGHLARESGLRHVVPTTTTLPANVTSIALGNNFGVALLSTGTAVTWGDNQSGQLGVGSASGPERCEGGTVPCSRSYVPVEGLKNVVAIAAGGEHALAIVENENGQRAVKAWGANADGQLGDGETTQSDKPVEVPGVAEPVAVAAGGRHSLALLKNGKVLAWGLGSAGQLGDGWTTRSTSAVEVKGLTEPVTQLAAGDSQSLAVLAGGTVMGWGASSKGELGAAAQQECEFTEEAEESDGQTHITESAVGHCSAVAVPIAGLSNVQAVAAGDGYDLALVKNENGERVVEADGTNEQGELGLDRTDISEESKFVQVNGLSGVTAIAAGGAHSLALAGGRVYAWGSNAQGQIGDDETNGPQKCEASECAAEPVLVDDLGSGEVKDIAAGGAVSMAYGPGGPTVAVTGLNPAYGPVTGGTQVRITGTELGELTGPRVTFGGKEAKVIRASGGEVTVETPAIGRNAATVPVMVWTTHGVSTGEPSYDFESAGSPEFGLCERESEGKYSDGTCVLESGGNFEWSPGVAFTEQRFTLSLGKATFETAAKHNKVVCKDTGSGGTGEYAEAIPNQVVNVRFKFTECELETLYKCQSGNLARGEIESEPVEGTLGKVSRESAAGLALGQVNGVTQPLIQAKCGPASLTIGGGVIAKMSPQNKMATSFTLEYSETNGQQQFGYLVEENNKPSYQLSLSDGNEGETAGLAMTAKILNPQEVELRNHS